MKFLLSITLACLCIFGHSAETMRRFVYFKSNQSTLSAEATSVIDGMLSDIGSGFITKIEIYGYTDSDGDADANQQLSERRTLSVKSYFISKGVEEKKIATESFGERNPAYSNDTEEGKRKNRRVEIAITYGVLPDQDPVLPVVEARIEHPMQVSGKAMRQIPLTNQHVQVFKFNAKRSFEVVGEKGTKLFFQPGSFVDPKGKTVNSEITIRLIEVYQKSEMINQQLSTVSNGHLLESGGMIFVTAYDDKNKLELAPGMRYEIAFPVDNKITGMQLFDGDTSGNEVNWVVQGSRMKPMYDYPNEYNDKSLNEYVFTSSSMGWINCDHFLDDKNLTTLTVTVDDTAGLKYCLVFKDINSMMSIGSRSGNGVQFLNVPVGREATILVFRKTPTETWFTTKAITLRENTSEAVKPQKLTEAEFQERIKEFN